MNVARHAVVLMGLAAAFAAGAFVQAQGENPPQGEKKMHGLIGKMTATAGQRDALVAILLEGTKEMPGCLTYVVAKDPADTTSIWVTEVWDSEESHRASLALPAVRDAIAKGRPMIASFDESVRTEPVGGHGLVQ